MTTDILLDENYGFQFENGDFAVGDSEEQNIKLLFDTYKSEWTQSPLTGIGLVKWLKGKLDARFEREVNLQFAADGLTDLRIEVQGEQIYISKK